MVLALLLLPGVAARHDEFLRLLVGAGLLALGRVAPRRHRVTAARGAAFAAAVRVIDRVHRNAAVVRTAAEPALAAGLADRGVHVVRVRHRADRRHALAENQALLAGIEPHDDVVRVAADDLRVRAGRTRELPALADLELAVLPDR